MNVSGFPYLVLAVMSSLLLSGCGSPESALSDAAGKPYSAEQLYARVEEKLTKARTLSFSFEATAQHGEAPPVRVEGSAAFAEGGRMRLELLEGPEEIKAKGNFVSDWTSTRLIGADETPEPAMRLLDMADEFRRLFSRYGATSGWYLATDFYLEDLKPENFKLGPKEKLDGRTAQIIEYELNVTWGPPVLEVSRPEPFRVKLWVDGGSGLPLRREVTMLKWTAVETYQDIKVDCNLDPRTFEGTK